MILGEIDCKVFRCLVECKDTDFYLLSLDILSPASLYSFLNVTIATPHSDYCHGLQGSEAEVQEAKPSPESRKDEKL